MTFDEEGHASYIKSINDKIISIIKIIKIAKMFKILRMIEILEMIKIIKFKEISCTIEWQHSFDQMIN